MTTAIPHQCWALQVPDGRFICAFNDRSLRLMPHCKAWEKFDLVNHQDGRVAFHNLQHRSFLSVNEAGEASQADHDRNWEQFTVQHSGVDDGTVVLRSYHSGHNLTVEGLNRFRIVLVPGLLPLLRTERIATAAPLTTADATNGGFNFGAPAPGGFNFGAPEALAAPAAGGLNFFAPMALGFYAHEEREDHYGGKEQYPGCFSGESMVRLADGSERMAADVQMGTDLLASDGTTCKLIARTIESHSSDVPHGCIKIGDLVITPRHPIQANGKWVKPKDLIGSSEGIPVQFAGDLLNFVTEPRAAIVINDILVSTLGFFCVGLDDEATYYGSEKVVKDLQDHPSWPSIRKAAKRAGNSC